MPRALAGLAALAPQITVSLREGTTPALTRALRAGTLDLAVIARTPPFRPPDTESPALELTTLSEREPVIGVSTRHPFATARAVEVQQLTGQVWVAARQAPDRGRRLAITTLAPITLDVLPNGVKAVAVPGEPRETRRVVLARRAGSLDGPAARVADALIDAAAA